MTAYRQRVMQPASSAAWAAAMLATMAGCQTPPPQLAPIDHAQLPDTHRSAENSYDWHGLLIAPFGSVLKDIPMPLHEVLLFRDNSHGSAAANDAVTADAASDASECYAADAPAPLFAGRSPDEYVLCFQQDRFFRLQASVRLAAAQASEVFAAACAGWFKNAESATGPAPGGEAPSADPQFTGACEGRDGGVRFRGRLEQEPDRAQMPPAESILSITLDNVPSP